MNAPEKKDDNHVIEEAAKSISVSLKTLTTTFGGVVAILGAIWAFDSHYASAADVDAVNRNVEAQVRSIRQERVEDELFKLDVKKQMQGGKLEAPEQALYERYARRLQQAEADQKAAAAAEATSSSKRGLLGILK